MASRHCATISAAASTLSPRALSVCPPSRKRALQLGLRWTAVWRLPSRDRVLGVRPRVRAGTLCGGHVPRLLTLDHALLPPPPVRCAVASWHVAVRAAANGQWTRAAARSGCWKPPHSTAWCFFSAAWRQLLTNSHRFAPASCAHKYFRF